MCRGLQRAKSLNTLKWTKEFFRCPCTFIDVDFEKDEWFGYARWYYKDKEFPALQRVWSDSAGYFPWHQECDPRVIDQQIILGRDARTYRWLEGKYFPKEPAASLVVRRYLTSEKFDRLIRDSAIYFRNARLFSDKFEGSIAKNLYDFYTSTLNEWQARVPKHEGAAAVLEFLRKRHHIANLTASYVNCWFADAHESAGMWTAYTGGSEPGLAIESRYGQLLRAFQQNLPTQHGLVQYVDFDSESFESPKLRYEFSEQPLMFKRIEYRDEHELRLIVFRQDEASVYLNAKDEDAIEPKHDGINLRVDLNSLLTGVVVGPNAPPNYVDQIQRRIADAGLKAKVSKSALDHDPFF